MKIIYLANLFFLKSKYFLLILISGFKFKYNNVVTNEFLTYINKIKKNGYCIIENYLTDNQCKEIIKDINTYIDTNQNKIYTDQEKSDYRIFGANNIKNEYILNFFKDLKILMVVENYMKLKIENAYTMAAKLLFKKKNLGSGGGWHRDSINLSVKAMVYLVDTTENNGPLQILENSNTFKNIFKDHILIKKINFRDTRFTNDEIIKITNMNKNKINTIKAKAGTLIIFDGSYIHRGSPIREGVRYAITNYYAPKLRVEREKEAVKSFLINSN
jgi:ectoine hydroxylase-related dioxygenase (phytanoyl-CoA dioxygenase family)